MRALFTLTAASALLAAIPAVAQDATSPAQPPVAPAIEIGGDSITIGGGIASVPDYEGSANNRVIAAAAARGSISGYTFSTRGARLFVDLLRNDPGPVYDFALGPVVALNFNRTNDVDDARVAALGEKKVAVELGGYAGIGKTGVITSDYDKLSASVAFTHDVTGAHGGYTIMPQIDYGTPLSRKAYVGLSGSATYANGDFADAYFRVTPTGTIASGLATFNPDGGWKNVSASAIGSYALTGDLLGGLMLVGGVSYSRLLNDFARSPIVRVAGDRDQWFGALGLGYTF